MGDSTTPHEDITKLVTTTLQARIPEGSSRPFPVMIAGKQLQLSQLLNIVSQLGGYSTTTAAAKWPLVASDLGLEARFAPTLKLVYLKYLKSLERSTSTTPTSSQELQHSHKQVRPAAEAQSKSREPKSEPEPEPRRSKRLRISESSTGCLQWLRSLALDPGAAANIPLKEKFLPRIKSLRLNIESEVKTRRRTKYSLRHLTSGVGITPPQTLEAAQALPTKEVPIGEEFQAKVPEFQSSAQLDDDEDSRRFLGRVVWKRRDEDQAREDEKLLQMHRSRNRCKCSDKGSMECVRLHVEAEHRWLKLLLGEPFAEWGFDRMGERVSKSWSIDEQNKFRRIFIRSGGAGKDVWTELKLAFPQKPRRELVSFYFNVFLLRKRAQQNRLGKKPDSDDDEEDPGYAPVSNPAASFGFHAVHLVELD